MGEKPSFDVGDSNPDKPSLVERTQSTNEAGGPSFDPFTPEFGLYKVVLNNLLEESYYDSVDESFDKVWNRFQAVADENPEFVLQLATYARQEEGFRDIAQLLLVLSANDDRTKQYVREYAPAIIDRTDEFNSVVSYQLRGFGKPIPKPLKKGIEDAFHKKYAIVKVEGQPFDDATARVTYIDQGDDETPTGVVSDGMEKVYEQNDVALNVENYGVSIVDKGYLHDEYTFSKHSQRNKEVSLHDVLNLVHPTPRSENRDELFGRIVKGELDDHPDVEPLREDRTWESEMSEDDDRSDAEKFRERLDDMGIMARVRNLRNMREAGLSGEEIFDYDVGDGGYHEFGPESERIVENSKQFPFRYYQAFKACGDVGISRSGGLGSRTKSFDIGRGDLLDAFSAEWLNEAINVSTRNLPDSLTNTFTAIDLSGSMDREVSNHSDMARAEIASLFGAMLMKRDSDVGAFGNDFATIEADATARQTTNTLEIAQRIYSVGDEVGNATNGFKALKWAVENEQVYDRFVVFTDEQLWDSTTYSRFRNGGQQSLKDWWDRYTDEVNPDATLYMCDLASYGELQFPESYDSVVQVQGWSSNVIDFIDKYEQADDVVSDIQSIEAEDY